MKTNAVPTINILPTHTKEKKIALPFNDKDHIYCLPIAQPETSVVKDVDICLLEPFSFSTIVKRDHTYCLPEVDPLSTIIKTDHTYCLPEAIALPTIVQKDHAYCLSQPRIVSANVKDQIHSIFEKRILLSSHQSDHTYCVPNTLPESPVDQDDRKDSLAKLADQSDDLKSLAASKMKVLKKIKKYQNAVYYRKKKATKIQSILENLKKSGKLSKRSAFHLEGMITPTLEEIFWRLSKKKSCQSTAFSQVQCKMIFHDY